MPFIKVEAWEGFSEELKKVWMEKLTEVTVNLFQLPADHAGLTHGSRLKGMPNKKARRPSGFP